MTSTELGYLSGVTSNIQTQLDGKALSSHKHVALKDPGSSSRTCGISWSGELSGADWLCAFDNETYADSMTVSIRAISPSNLRTTIDAAPTEHSHNSLLDYYDNNYTFIPAYKSTEHTSPAYVACWDMSNAKTYLRAISPKNLSTLLNCPIFDSNGTAIVNRGYGIGSYNNSNILRYLIYLGLTDDTIHIGYDSNNPIFIDGRIILQSNDYGSSLPSSGKTGEVFFLKSS